MSLKFPISLVGKSSSGGGDEVAQADYFWNLDHKNGVAQWYDSANQVYNLSTTNAASTTSTTIGGTSRLVADPAPFQGIAGGGKAFTSGTTEFSVSLWFNIDGIGFNDQAYLFSFGRAGFTRIFDIRIPTYTNRYLEADLFDTNQTLYQLQDQPRDVTIPNGKWLHAVITFDGIFLRMYIGDELGAPVEVQSLDCTGFSGLPTVNELLAIGSPSWALTNSGLGMNGKIGMVGVWEKALAQNEINHLWGNGSGRQYDELTIT